MCLPCRLRGADSGDGGPYAVYHHRDVIDSSESTLKTTIHPLKVYRKASFELSCSMVEVTPMLLTRQPYPWVPSSPSTLPGSIEPPIAPHPTPPHPQTAVAAWSRTPAPRASRVRIEEAPVRARVSSRPAQGPPRVRRALALKVSVATAGMLPPRFRREHERTFWRP